MCPHQCHIGPVQHSGPSIYAARADSGAHIPTRQYLFVLLFISAAIPVLVVRAGALVVSAVTALPVTAVPVRELRFPLALPIRHNLKGRQ